MQQLQWTKNNYSQGRTCFFPLCWLFNYIWVGKACIYGALIESEPVQLKCLQANVWSHKAVPLGRLHSSTRLLMIAVCLPWRQGPSARHWHMPGNSNWGKAVCVCVWSLPPRPAFCGNLGVCGRKKKTTTTHQADSRCHLWKSLGHIPFKPTCWLKICFHDCPDQLPELANASGFYNLGMPIVVRGKAGRLKC